MKISVWPRGTRVNRVRQAGSFEFLGDLLADLEGGEADRGADGCDQEAGVRTPGDQQPDCGARGVSDKPAPASMNRDHLVSLRAGEEDGHTIRGSDRSDPFGIRGAGRIRRSVVGHAGIDDLDPMDLSWRAQGGTRGHLCCKPLDVQLEPIRRGLEGAVSRPAQIEATTFRSDRRGECMGEALRLQEVGAKQQGAVGKLVVSKSGHGWKEGVDCRWEAWTPDQRRVQCDT